MPSSHPHGVSAIMSSQPAARQQPKPPDAVLAEAERQWIFSEDELLRAPSIADGMSPEAEKEIRSKGVNFITQVGIMLKLPQVTLSTAAIFFNRFLMRRSLQAKDGYKPLHHYQVAATALFLATKVEETCRKIKELVVACCRVAQKNPNLLVDEQTKDFWKWRDTILFNEDVLLECLCFDLTIDSPYKLLYDMLKGLQVHDNKKLRNAAWSFISDSSLTQLCLLFSSRAIAAAAIYCGAKHAEHSFPDGPDGRPWWERQGVRLRDVRRACNYMAGVYEHSPLRAGGESIYVGLGTPEDADPQRDATRQLRSEQAPLSPTASAAGMERSGSAQSLKRARDEGPAQTANGVETRNGDVKRPKLEPNAEDNGLHDGAGTQASKAEPEPDDARSHQGPGRLPEDGDVKEEDDDGSEEGEVEE